MTRPVPKKPAAEKEVLSLPEASDYLGVSDDTTRELAHSGKIPAGQLRRRWRFLKADLNFFIRHNKNPLVAEAEERAKAQEAKQETLVPEKVLKPKKPKRTVTTALLLKHAVDTLSATPCYLVGPASQSMLNTHVRDNGSEWDVEARDRSPKCSRARRSCSSLMSRPRLPTNEKNFCCPRRLKVWRS